MDGSFGVNSPDKMQPIEPDLLGHVIRASSENEIETPDDFIRLIIDTYLWAYDLTDMEDQDEERIRDLINRVNGFTVLSDDERFEACFCNGPGQVFVELNVALTEADYEIADDGIARFDFDEVAEIFFREINKRGN